MSNFSLLKSDQIKMLKFNQAPYLSIFCISSLVIRRPLPLNCSIIDSEYSASCIRRKRLCNPRESAGLGLRG